MFRLAAVCASALALSGCFEAQKRAASSVGACAAFVAPSEPIQGVRPSDRRWIAKTTEAGISACGWARPARRSD